MWSQVTRNRYPSGKMKVVGSSSSKKDPGLQSDLDYMQSIYDVLGMKFSGGGSNVKVNPFSKGSFAFPIGKAAVRGNYEKMRSGHGFRNYDWNVGISVPLDFKWGKRK